MDKDEVRTNVKKTKQRKRKRKYKMSRIIIVIVGLILTLSLIVSAGKFLVGLLPSKETPEAIANKYEQQIKLAKDSIGENIIYVTANFKDSDGSSYKGVAFLNENELMFIGIDAFEKRIGINQAQNIKVGTKGGKYEVVIKDKDENVFKVSKIKKNNEGDGFVAILNRLDKN